MQINPLSRFCKQNELGKLSEDACYLERRDVDSRKPFRWQTYHHHPYGCEVKSTCYPGQLYWDGHGPGACNVDDESRINRNPGYQATNLNVHQELPTLPINMPRVRGWFNSDIESNLRPEAEFNDKECKTVTEKSFIPVTFQDFTHLCYDPQDPTYIIPEDSFNNCFKNAKYYHRAGEDTRHDRLERYRNACNWTTKFPPMNLSFSNFGF